MNIVRVPVTVVVLTRNEEMNIRRALESVARGSNLPEAVLVLDNGSSDRTLAVVEAVAQEKPELRLRSLALGTNNIGAARAAGVELAETEFVAFLDADCEAPRGWLADLLDGFALHDRKSGRLAAVGAPSLPPENEDDFYLSVRRMTSVFLGHLNSPQAAPPREDREVAHLPGGNLLLHRASVLANGNFSANFSFVCEDVELGLRLRKSGWKLVMLPEPVVVHRFGIGLSEWTERMFRFGLGQMLVGVFFPGHIGLRLALPPLFLLGYTGALVGSIFSPELLWLPVAYFLTIALAAASVTRRKDASHLWGNVFLLFLATHFAYALGETVGLVRYFLPELIRRAFSGKLLLEKTGASSVNWLRPATKKVLRK